MATGSPRRWANESLTLTKAPIGEPWGARTFDTLDPFGSTLFVMGPLAANDERAAPVASGGSL
jgi:hypothetical protein